MRYSIEPKDLLDSASNKQINLNLEQETGLK